MKVKKNSKWLGTRHLIGIYTSSANLAEKWSHLPLEFSNCLLLKHRPISGPSIFISNQNKNFLREFKVVLIALTVYLVIFFQMFAINSLSGQIQDIRKPEVTAVFGLRIPWCLLIPDAMNLGLSRPISWPTLRPYGWTLSYFLSGDEK